LEVDAEAREILRLRAQLLPKLDAFRNAGFTAETNHTAFSNVYRLEKRKDVQDRIAYFCRDEEVLQEKRKRIEGVLWLVHEANVADLWETVEVPVLHKDGPCERRGSGRPTAPAHEQVP
jgi:hypothetical protein